LHAAKSAIKNLRDATVADLALIDLPVLSVLYRRAHHVITEDDRTLAARDALKAGDYDTVGRLMYESHESLRVDYEVSTEELDALVKFASELGRAGGVYGARVSVSVCWSVGLFVG
jgi:galactokinase